ncbi:unnamed protein product [Brassica rapa subsp. narinosa]|nr:unnamed protein product [Brassica oleracea]
MKSGADKRTLWAFTTFTGLLALRNRQPVECRRRFAWSSVLLRMFRLLEELEHNLNQANNNNNTATAAFPLLNHLIRLNYSSKVHPTIKFTPSQFQAHVFLSKRNHPYPSKERKAIRCAERMIRRSGVSREEVVSSLVSTYSNCGSNDSVFDLLIRTYVQARKLREAHEAFTLLRSKGSYRKLGEARVALGCLSRHFSEWNFNVYILNIMVNALCKDVQMDKVGDFLSQVQEKMGVYPDIVTYNTLISAYSSKGFMEEAFELMNAMPSKKRYEVSVVSLFARSGDLDKALVYFDFVKDAGLVPDNVIYTVLIQGYCKKGMISEAMDLRNEILRRGCCMDAVAYNTILHGLCKRKMLGDADKLFREMTERGLFPDSYTITILIDGHCKLGNLQNAMELFKKMKQKRIRLDVVTYNTLLDGFGKVGDIDTAKEIWTDMVSREILPTPVSYSIMVNALCSKGHLSEAFRGYCWSGNASDGESFLDKMVSEGFVPDIITYNTLIYGYDREENMSRAFGLVKKMEEEKQGGGLLVPDVFTYNSILHGFCRQNQMKETEAVLRKMIERGVNPDKSTYTARINGFVSQDNLTEAFRFHWRQYTFHYYSPLTFF